jgi:hypothetical protein
MNSIDAVVMVNVDLYLYEQRVIWNLLLNYDYVIAIQANEVTEVYGYDLKKQKIFLLI